MSGSLESKGMCNAFFIGLQSEVFASSEFQTRTLYCGLGFEKSDVVRSSQRLRKRNRWLKILPNALPAIAHHLSKHKRIQRHVPA